MASRVDTVMSDFQMLDELDEPFEREPSNREPFKREPSSTDFSMEWLKSYQQEIGTSYKLNGSMPREKVVLAPNRIKHSKWSKSLSMFGLMLLAMLCASPRLVQMFGDRDAVASVGRTSADLVTAPSKPRLLTKPIEEIRCGDRIPSELPEGLFPEEEAEPDQATWRLVELELTKANGDIVEVKLLRPLAWLEQAGAITEGVFDVNVEELGIEGKAAVLQILACPPIQGGEGQVVTGTFRHTSDSLVELQIEGEPDPIVCTSGHLIWSEDRHEFVRATELRMGEGLRLALRKSRLQSLNRIGSERVVCNFEVAQTHVYMVGAQGILVHNAGASCDNDSGSPVRVTGQPLADMRRAFAAVKPQAWMDEAAANASKYSAAQLERMKKGLAPLGDDGFSMEIHHLVPLAEGGTNAMSNFQFLTRTLHRLGLNYKINHPNLP